MVCIIIGRTCFGFFFLSHLKFHEFTTFLSFSFSCNSLDHLTIIYKFVPMPINFHSIERKLEHSTNRSLAMPAQTFSVVITFRRIWWRKKYIIFSTDINKNKIQKMIEQDVADWSERGIKEKKQLDFVSSLNTLTANWIDSARYSHS